MLESAARTKQLLFNTFSAKPEIKKPEIKEAAKEYGEVKDKFSTIFDSKLLSLEHVDFLNTIISDVGRLQRVERLFRASEHSFSADAFHNKCDNKEDTLVLIRTEFGKTIGGYTHYYWT